jgi:hypothetical protein
MKKPIFERHSIATLSQRLKGLISRNTVEAWLESGQLEAEINPWPRNPNPGRKAGERYWLFRSDYLDGVEADLERKHEERVRRQLGNSAGAKIIRETARRHAMEILNENLRQPKGSTRIRPEKNPALSDKDAIGRTDLWCEKPGTSIQSGWGA